MPLFERYLGIDYSGAETPTASLKGLRVYQASQAEPAREAMPPAGARKYWTRKGIAQWLAARLGERVPTIVGIDHAFSFPKAYFDRHSLPYDWPAFLVDFHQHWPTDGDTVYVDFVRDGLVGAGVARMGNARWRRVTEVWAGSAKSAFHFDVQGSVAKSTHSGLPWLLYLRRLFPDQLHFWPFDGWAMPEGKSAIVEVYPALWSRRYPVDNRTGDQHDAYSVATWLREADLDGSLQKYLSPSLDAADERGAAFEGWILGVGATGNAPPAIREGRPETPSLIARLTPKGRRGSKARCHLLTHGPRQEVADRLSRLSVPFATVDPTDDWMPNGFDDREEAQLPRAHLLLEESIRRELASWWLVAAVESATTPNWDLASTCTIEGRKGLLLVEAKAHAAELETDGKSIEAAASTGSRRNHLRIQWCIEDAGLALAEATGHTWAISSKGHYQLANRFAWSWKLAELGVPVVLVYLGFLEASDMFDKGAPIKSHEHWVEIMLAHSSGIIPPNAWETPLRTRGASFTATMRSAVYQIAG